MHMPEQAIALWCPMVRADRWINDKRCCIADKCAMWRWGTHQAPPANAEPGKLYLSVEVQSDVGYCGLAGRPGAAA